MYSQIQQVGLRAYSLAELPPLAFSVIVAETFYKFHSFTLECVGFLATWYLASLGYNGLRSLLTRRR